MPIYHEILTSQKTWNPTVRSELLACVYMYVHTHYMLVWVYVHILIDDWRTINSQWNKRVTLKLQESSNGHRSDAITAIPQQHSQGATKNWALPPVWHHCVEAETPSRCPSSPVASHCWSLSIGLSTSRKDAVFKLSQEKMRDEVRSWQV